MKFCFSHEFQDKMKFCILVFVLLLKNSVGSKPIADTPPKLAILPGRGFDPLVNKDMAVISNTSFRAYHRTPDERYTIPLGFVASLKQEFDLKVDVFAHYTEFFPVTAPTFNSIKWQNILRDETTVLQIDGSFSKRYKKAKRLYLDYHMSTIRTTGRFTVYKIYVYKDHGLDNEIYGQMQSMIDDIVKGNLSLAVETAEKIVRDFGVRHITSVDVGGLFVREEFVNKSFVLAYRETIAPSAVQSFMEVTDMPWSVDISKKVKTLVNDCGRKELARYKTNVLNTDTYVIGGSQVFNMKKWISTVRNNLAIIDRDGEQLHRTVTATSAFRDVSKAILRDVTNIIKFAVDKYYRLNAHKGCMRLFEPAVYDSSVNLPLREKCDKPMIKYTLGGFYQTCVVYYKNHQESCKSNHFVNGLTGHRTCPPGHEDFLLSKRIQLQPCPGHGENKSLCPATIDTHWCRLSGNVQTNVTYRFGGIYSTHITNIMTGARGCPANFYALSIFNSFICTSYLNQPNQLHEKESKPIYFGGFLLVCKSADLEQQQNCQFGYTRHFVSFYDSCEVYYCAHYGPRVGNIYMSLLVPPHFVESKN